jgi:diguanylate cyclase (GGDEF)-like protein
LIRLTGQRMHSAIVTGVASCVGAEYGALALFDPREGALRIRATFGYPHAIVEHIRVWPGEGVFGQVFASGIPLLVGKGGSPAPLPFRPRYRSQSYIVMPIATGSTIRGVIAVSNPCRGDHFDRRDLRSLRLLVPVVALALDRERLQEEMKEIAEGSIMDYVTRLPNRQYLEGRLHAEMHRAMRLGQPLAVMLLDIDNFKLVNDIWGHLEGDRVLREIAGLLSEHVRTSDVCTRYGGEEFAILMPGAALETAIPVAERVRMAVAEAYRDRDTGARITLSAGVTLLNSTDTADTVLRRADRALLRAKGEGKNAVRSE